MGPLEIGEAERYICNFADLVASDRLKNMVMDSMQDHKIDYWSFDCLKCLRQSGHALALLEVRGIQNRGWRLGKVHPGGSG